MEYCSHGGLALVYRDTEAILHYLGVSVKLRLHWCLLSVYRPRSLVPVIHLCWRGWRQWLEHTRGRAYNDTHVTEPTHNAAECRLDHWSHHNKRHAVSVSCQRHTWHCSAVHWITSTNVCKQQTKMPIVRKSFTGLCIIPSQILSQTYYNLKGKCVYFRFDCDKSTFCTL